MQVGCGVYVHTIRGRRYLYLWHYEVTGGRRRQEKEYLGPAGQDDVRSEAVRRISAYYRIVSRDLERQRKAALSEIARMR